MTFQSHSPQTTARPGPDGQPARSANVSAVGKNTSMIVAAPSPLLEEARDLTPLDQAEQESLQEHEATITANLQAFVQVGEALRKIRDGRLYRETHATFEAYCRTRWDLGRAHAYRLIGAAETVAVLSPLGDILPACETQARALLQFDLEDRPRVWQDVVAQCGCCGQKLTTRHVEQTVRTLIHASDDAPYRKRRTALRRQKREAIKQQERRHQHVFCEAGVKRLAPKHVPTEETLARWVGLADTLSRALERAQRDFQEIEVPEGHPGERRMLAIEVAIDGLARWVQEQRQVAQTGE